MPKFHLMEEDLTLIRWINEFGFVEIRHLVTEFNREEKKLSLRLKQLVNHGYLLYEKIFHGKQGVFRATSMGARTAASPLPALRKINISQYHHNLLLVDLAFLLIQKFGGTFTSERRVRQESGFVPIGQKGHSCDGELNREGNKIAIELELTSKGNRRLEDILKQYIRRMEYQEVWYFCGNHEIKNRLEQHEKKLFFIKSFMLSDFLKESCE